MIANGRIEKCVSFFLDVKQSKETKRKLRKEKNKNSLRQYNSKEKRIK
jgi:hypothetical protein